MSGEAGPVAIAAVLDAISLLRGEVAALARSHERIEASHRNLHERLDAIEASQAGVSELQPFLERLFAQTMEGHRGTENSLEGIASVVAVLARQAKANQEDERDARQKILTRLASVGETTEAVLPALEAIVATQKGDRASTQDRLADLGEGVEKLLENAKADREQIRSDFESTGTLIAWTRAAVLGDRSALPINVEDHPLLERYLLQQPADLTSNDRALVDWRAAAAAASTADLLTLLRKQQEPSPTDTRQTRILRYRLAAITRAQIAGRGGELPPTSATTRASDRTAAAGMIRSHELADLWRSGNDTAILAEPELASVFDVFAAAQRSIGVDVDRPMPPELLAFYTELTDRIELGERPTLRNTGQPRAREQTAAIEATKDR